MMLTALYDYAQRKGLLDDPGYEKRRIDLTLKLDAKGRYLAIVEAPKEGLTLKVPRQATRTVAITPGFIVDNVKYVLGLTKPDAPKKDTKRALECNEKYREQLEKALGAHDDSALKALVAFEKKIEANRDLVLGDRPAKEWSGSENIAILVGEEWVHDRPAVRVAWAAMRTGETSKLAPVRCLVTGQLAPPELTHPPIKRLPGTQQAQTMLVSFNADAFTSMDFEQGQNAQVSRQGAEGYVTALNDLMSKDPSKDRRYSSGIGLGNDSVMLVWTKEATPELADLLDYLDAREADSGIETVGAPWSGRFQASQADSTDFFAATLGGNAARVVVRDWYQTRFGVVKAAVRKWFADLELVGVQRAPAIWQLLQAIDPPGNAEVPPSLATALGRAALFGGRVPLEVLRHALQRLRVPPKPKEKYLLQQRIALIKLTLIRTLNQEVSVALDEEKIAVPYLSTRAPVRRA